MSLLLTGTLCRWHDRDRQSVLPGQRHQLRRDPERSRKGTRFGVRQWRIPTQVLARLPESTPTPLSTSSALRLRAQTAFTTTASGNASAVLRGKKKLNSNQHTTHLKLQRTWAKYYEVQPSHKFYPTLSRTRRTVFHFRDSQTTAWISPPTLCAERLQRSAQAACLRVVCWMRSGGRTHALRALRTRNHHHHPKQCTTTALPLPVSGSSANASETWKCTTSLARRTLPRGQRTRRRPWPERRRS